MNAEGHQKSQQVADDPHICDDVPVLARSVPARRVELIEVRWRLSGKNGRVIACEVYRVDVGYEVRAGYSFDDLLRTEYAETVDTANTIANEWKRVLTETGYPLVVVAPAIGVL